MFAVDLGRGFWFRAPEEPPKTAKDARCLVLELQLGKDQNASFSTLFSTLGKKLSARLISSKFSWLRCR